MLSLNINSLVMIDSQTERLQIYCEIYIGKVFGEESGVWRLGLTEDRGREYLVRLD